MKREQKFAAKVVRVVDGDTFEATVELGFSVKLHKKVRMRFINAPEMKDGGLVNAAGERARQFLIERLMGRTVELVTWGNGEDKYGRIEAEVLVDGVSVNQEMINNGFAVAYVCENNQEEDGDGIIHNVV